MSGIINSAGSRSGVLGAGVVRGTTELDYETGTFDPVVTSDGGSGSMTMTAWSVDTCSYSRIGNLVTCSGKFGTTSVASCSGNVKVVGFPYNNSAGEGHEASFVSGYAEGLNITSGTTVGGFMPHSQSYVWLMNWDIDTGITQLNVTEWTDDGLISFTLSYITED